MTVTKEEIRQLVDQLKDEHLDEVFEHMKDLIEGEAVELTDGEVEGLIDQDEYYKEEDQASKVQKQKDISSRGSL